MENKIERTSAEWQKDCTVKVIDADGWDRRNFDFVWNNELITRKEFERRLGMSTVWCNRAEQPAERLPGTPMHQVTSLDDLAGLLGVGGAGLPAT